MDIEHAPQPAKEAHRDQENREDDCDCQVDEHGVDHRITSPPRTPRGSCPCPASPSRPSSPESAGAGLSQLPAEQGRLCPLGSLLRPWKSPRTSLHSSNTRRRPATIMPRSSDRSGKRTQRAWVLPRVLTGRRLALAEGTPRLA